MYYWPGIDFSNARMKDFENLHNFEKTVIDRSIHPRMPWHDVSVYLEGPVVSDLCRHFIERWNFARTSFQQKKKFTIVNGKICIKIVKNNIRNYTKSQMGSANTSVLNSTLHTPLIAEEYKRQPHTIYNGRGNITTIIDNEYGSEIESNSQINYEVSTMSSHENENKNSHHGIIHNNINPGRYSSCLNLVSIECREKIVLWTK